MFDDDVRRDPTSRDLNVFGVLLIAFAAALAVVALWKPQALIAAAAVLGAAALACLAFHRGAPLSRKLAGLTFPALFGLIGLTARWGAPPAAVAGGVAGLGVALGLVVWAQPAFARRLYAGWSAASEPIGWTISHVVMALVFYGVLTPVGLVFRLVGRDPLHRRFEPEAPTYWVPRRAVTDVKRYFRQF